MLPGVSIQKNQFATGSTSPSAIGILAIIASAMTGTQNVATSFARDDLAAAAFQGGPLVEYASYTLQTAQKPVVLVRSAASQASSYGTIVSTPGTGTSTVTGDGTILPSDDFNPLLLTIVNGGTVGVAGITYTLSFDGINQGPVTALGTANTITDPSGRAKFDLGAGTLAPGATFAAYTTRPQPNNTDLPAALEALRITRQPWEGVFIDCVYQSGTVGLIDAWLASLEAVGQFRFAIISLRHKLTPVPGTESESAYATYCTTTTGTDASIRMCVGADAADQASTLTGVTQPRPTGMFLAAHAMAVQVGTDPAYVGAGNLSDCQIADGNGNPKWHDEDLYPTLDGLRLVALRSFAPGGPVGTYINNANVLSSPGSDYEWLQHIRTMNLACGIAWQILTNQLSIGVGKQAPDPVTGKVYIQEKDAQRIEGLVNAALAQPTKGQVTSVAFKLSRTDDLSANSASTVTGTLNIVSLAYLKLFKVISAFAP